MRIETQMTRTIKGVSVPVHQAVSRGRQIFLFLAEKGLSVLPISTLPVPKERTEEPSKGAKNVSDFLDVSDEQKASSVPKRFIGATEGKANVLSNHAGIFQMVPVEKLSVPCAVEMSMIERDPERLLMAMRFISPRGMLRLQPGVAQRRCLDQGINGPSAGV